MNTPQPVDVSMESKEVSGPAIDWSALELGKNTPRWSGGFADVFVGSHPQLGPLALKRPRGACLPGSREYRHLEKEVAIWKDLIHPNVLLFIGICEKDEAVYIVAPFFQNGTVPQYISNNPDANRAAFIRDLAKGLHYLHQRGIVHGDIKGSNLLVSSSVPVEGVVADFGLSKLVDTQTVSSQQGAGTPRWQSPELMYGAPRSFESDVYAFGMTVYEIISGKVPFEDIPYYAIFFKVHNQERPVPTPLISPSGYDYTREWDVAQTAWDHDPQFRPSMERVLQLLEPPQKPEHLLEGRIKVVCDKKPQHDGYISRTLDRDSGSQMVTQNTEDALIIAWDPTSTDPPAFEMANNTQNQRWLALRFVKDSPDLKQDRRLWATFTAANGTKDNCKIVPTPYSPGQQLIVTWALSDSGKLTANALGETLETGLNTDPDPPHLFFCHRMENYWAKVRGRFAVHFVLEPLESQDSCPRGGDGLT